MKTEVSKSRQAGREYGLSVVDEEGISNGLARLKKEYPKKSIFSLDFFNKGVQDIIKEFDLFEMITKK